MILHNQPSASVSFLAATSSDNPRVSSMNRPKMIALGVASIARYPTTLESPPRGSAGRAIALFVVRSYFGIRVRSNPGLITASHR